MKGGRSEVREPRITGKAGKRRRTRTKSDAFKFCFYRVKRRRRKEKEVISLSYTDLL